MAGPTTPAADEHQRCSGCGKEFRCGGAAGDPDCWCAALPPLQPVPGRSCLCPRCLERETVPAFKAG